MFRILLVLVAFFCIVGCGTDSPVAPNTDIENMSAMPLASNGLFDTSLIQDIEVADVAAAPRAINGYDITKFVFTTFEKEEVWGERLETHTYHLRVTNIRMPLVIMCLLTIKISRLLLDQEVRPTRGLGRFLLRPRCGRVTGVLILLKVQLFVR